MGFCYYSCSINRTLQIACYHHINRFIFPFLTELTSLFYTIIIQLALSLSLHYLIGVIYRFAMPY